MISSKQIKWSEEDKKIFIEFQELKEKVKLLRKNHDALKGQHKKLKNKHRKAQETADKQFTFLLFLFVCVAVLSVFVIRSVYKEIQTLTYETRTNKEQLKNVTRILGDAIAAPSREGNT